MKCCTTNMPTLNKLVTVERKKSDLTQNAGGHIDETSDANWQQAGREWAACVTKGSRETLIDDQIRQFALHEWTIRYSNQSSGYTTGMRLRMDGRKFYISDPPQNVDEQNKYIVLTTTEVPTV